MIHSNNSSYLKFYDSELYRYHNAFLDSSKMLLDGAYLTGFFADFQFTEDVEDIDFVLKNIAGSEIDLKSIQGSDQFSKTNSNFPVYLGTSRLTSSISDGCYYIVIRSATNEVYSDVFLVKESEIEITEFALIVFEKEQSLNNSIIFNIELKTAVNSQITVDWDDGNTETITVTSAGYEFSNTYTVNDTYNIKVYGAIQNVNYFYAEHTETINPSGVLSGYVSNVSYENMYLLSNVETLIIDTKTNVFPFSDFNKLVEVQLPGSKYPYFDTLDGLENSRLTLKTFKTNSNKLYFVFRDKTYQGLQQCNLLETLEIRNTNISSIFYESLNREDFTELVNLSLQGCLFVRPPLIGFEVGAPSAFTGASTTPYSGFDNLDIYNISYNYLSSINVTSFGIPSDFFVNGTQYNFRNNNLDVNSVDILFDGVADHNKYISDELNTTNVIVNTFGGTSTGSNAIPTREMRIYEILDGGDLYNIGDTITAGNSGELLYTVTDVQGTGEITEIEITDGGSGYDNSVLTIQSTSGSGTGASIEVFSSVAFINSRNGTTSYNS